MKTKPRFTAVLDLPDPIPDKLKVCKSIYGSMCNNSSFPNPPTPYTTVLTHLTSLDAAETLTHNKTAGSVEARDVELKVVLTDMDHLKGYAQRVADANPAKAEVIITSAGMKVKKKPSFKKSAFVARHGAVSSTVQLIARAAIGRASYEWQWSLDQIDWTSLPVTLQASTMVHGLKPGTTVYFRYRAVTKLGQGNWSQIACLIVQ